MKKLLVMVATVTLAVAAASEKSYHVTLNEPAMVNGTQLKPGDYKIQVEGDKATLKIGKTVIEAPAKIEMADHKFDTTSIDINNANSKAQINEIHIGGTKTRIVFSNTSAAGQ